MDADNKESLSSPSSRKRRIEAKEKRQNKVGFSKKRKIVEQLMTTMTTEAKLNKNKTKTKMASKSDEEQPSKSVSSEKEDIGEGQSNRIVWFQFYREGNLKDLDIIGGNPVFVQCDVGTTLVAQFIKLVKAEVPQRFDNIPIDAVSVAYIPRSGFVVGDANQDPNLPIKAKPKETIATILRNGKEANSEYPLMVLIPKAKTALDSYLFKESVVDALRVQNASHFSRDSLGMAHLPRQGLMDAIRAAIRDIDASESPYPNSVYLYGMKGSGKSILLGSVGKELQNEGYLVYYLKDASLLPQIRPDEHLPEDESVKVAVLVDEVNTNVTSGWIGLLKNTRPNLITIGAGTVQYLSSEITGTFKSRINVNMFLPNDRKSQLQELIGYWRGLLGADSKAAIRDICKYLCNYCGGHFFATSKFTEYAFCTEEGKSCNESLASFRIKFHSEEFRESKQFQVVKGRCLDFEEYCLMGEIRAALLGNATAEVINRLARLGLWSSTDHDLVSPLVINECFSNIPLQEGAIRLSKDDGPQYNLEQIIILGLKEMTVTNSPSS